MLYDTKIVCDCQDGDLAVRVLMGQNGCHFENFDKFKQSTQQY
jgi:hypothetical protein